MKVPLLDLKRRSAELDARLHAAFRRVLDSGHYILGPEVEAFEREIAEHVGARHAVAVSSGTDALLVALMALGVGPGDEAICPTYTFFASAGTIWRTGARPVFVDSEPDTLNLDPAACMRALGPKTKAIMPVHLFGQCADLEPILEAARTAGVVVIEDAAQAIGAEYRGRRAGTLGTFGCFSFFPSKNLGGFGDSGLVTTDDAELAQRVRALRAHGGQPKYHHKIVGGNFRMDALHAALLRVLLGELDRMTAERQANAACYSERLGGLPSLSLPRVLYGRHIFNQYVVQVPGSGRRDALRRHLDAQGVGTEIYYPVPMHLQECFAPLGHRRGEFPVAEAAAAESLALPVFAGLLPDELDHVAASVRAFIAGEPAA